MANLYVVAFLLAGLYTSAYCRHRPAHQEKETEQQLPAEHDHNVPYRKVAAANHKFTFDLYKAVVSTAAKSNVFFSPLSVSMAFSLMILGARSSTQRQLLSGLCFNQPELSEHEIHEGFHHLLRVLSSPDTEIEWDVGSALFIDEKLKPLKTFVDNAKHFYNAEVAPTNFENPEEAQNQINSYIGEKTRGKLQDVIKGLDREALMVLVNYVFLKAYWQYPFNYELTREADFFVDKHTTVRVPMMNRDGIYNSYHDTDLACHVVEIPYKGSARALFVLPEAGKMKQVEDALNEHLLFKWLDSMKSGRLDLSLPRFSASGKYVLKGLMRKLGIVDVFTNNADLSGITRDHNLRVSKAIHQAYLNVHENGTEAAATTVMEITPTSLPPRMELNHPFIVIICEAISRSILFIGRMNNPTTD